MVVDVQPEEPPLALLAIASDVVPGWLRRITVVAAGGRVPPGLEVELDAMIARAAPELLDRLATLLASDVDAQSTNPLSLFRESVAAPTALLRAWDVPAPRPDPYTSDRFPDDIYRLGPASWSDVDDALHEPGLTWGAWKAMIVLRRRRDEGLR